LFLNEKNIYLLKIGKAIAMFVMSELVDWLISSLNFRKAKKYPKTNKLFN